ncbi:hypothetical protein QUF72_10745 [Desulfobacterales bacterium HSG2]|nr:hypothetical protein [Desulfobacterales bacterium HSG2]
MKLIRLEQGYPELNQMINMAGRETLILRKPGGEMFVFSQIDEFDAEAELLKNNKEFMEFLKSLSEEDPVISMGELRQELDV